VVEKQVERRSKRSTHRCSLKFIGKQFVTSLPRSAFENGVLSPRRRHGRPAHPMPTCFSPCIFSVCVSNGSVLLSPLPTFPVGARWDRSLVTAFVSGSSVDELTSTVRSMAVHSTISCLKEVSPGSKQDSVFRRRICQKIWIRHVFNMPCSCVLCSCLLLLLTPGMRKHLSQSRSCPSLLRRRWAVAEGDGV
jgi:hypothetical protein